MKIGTDGSVTTPDPDVLVSLDDDDVETVIDAIHAALMLSTDADYTAALKRTLAKFQRIWDSRAEDADDPPDVGDDPDFWTGGRIGPVLP